MARSDFYPSTRFTRTNFIFRPKGLAMKIKIGYRLYSRR